MSRKFFTHATPTLFNSGTPKPQMSSCFLLKMKEDSIEGIYDTLKQCALISKSVAWRNHKGHAADDWYHSKHLARRVLGVYFVILLHMLGHYYLDTFLFFESPFVKSWLSLFFFEHHLWNVVVRSIFTKWQTYKELLDSGAYVNPQVGWFVRLQYQKWSLFCFRMGVIFSLHQNVFSIYKHVKNSHSCTIFGNGQHVLLLYIILTTKLYQYIGACLNPLVTVWKNLFTTLVGSPFPKFSFESTVFQAGGIGVAISNVRASGSYIRGTNGHSNGLVPMLRNFNETARYVDQGGGKRKGSFAM